MTEATGIKFNDNMEVKYKDADMIDSDLTKATIAAFISIVSASIGEIIFWVNEICLFPFVIKVGTVDILLQRAAWTIAILAGLISVATRIRTWVNVKKQNNGINRRNKI
jgi:EamA domain-containing membrane protein RarD